MNVFEIFSDGASSGNPGPSAIGVVVRVDGEVVKEIAEFIGLATNNVAEYRALIRGLQEALSLGAEHVCLRVDSELVFFQVKGKYKVKHENMKPLHAQVILLLKGFKKVEFKVVPREENKEADCLASSVLKKIKSQDSRSDVFMIGEESPGSIG